jgi:predicted negative regulator of RcsB-dependent stress response
MHRSLMAKRKPSPSRPKSAASASADDAFTAGILEFIAWARERTQLLVAALVVLILAVVGVVYGVNQRAERLSRAAEEFESLQMVAMIQEPPQARAEIRAYIDRFRGTPYALEAYLLLGELYLDDEQPAEAVAVLEEIAPAYRSPLEVQATFLLATALEEAARWEDAAALYEELMARTSFTFQKREAAEGLARAHLARGDRSAAIQAYHAILEALDAQDPQRRRYEMRVAELEAQGP